MVPSTAQAVDLTSKVVINEVYGGGGNAGATYLSDFIELFNTGTTPIDLSGYSVQYASSAGGNWAQTPLSGSVAPGAYYLVKEADGANTSATPLPTPDVTGTIPMSGTGGKVALVNNQTALACGTDCDGNAAVVDFVGWGTTANDSAGSPAPATTNSTSVARNAAHANTGNNAVDFIAGAATPGTGPTDPGVPQPKTIEEIQGTGAASPLAGKAVITKGVVTAAYPVGGKNGYTIQTPGTGGAIDFASHTGSDAVFVFSAATVGSVAIGDYVQVTGIVSEFNGLTEVTVSTAADLVKLTDTVEAPTAATTTAPLSTDVQRESLESMLYRPTGDYTITNTYGTNQYGELGLASGDQPLLQWTEVAKPGTAEANAVKADNAARAVVLDDGATTNFLSAANSAQTPPYISMSDPIRVGAPVTFTKDVIVDYANNAWKFQPTAQVTPADAAAYPATWTDTRTAAPDDAKINADGQSDFKVASFNVLNYFTKLGADVAGCTSYNDREGNPIAVNSCPGNGPRGAWDAANLQRQQDKIVAAINGSGANVAGLMEIENSVVLGETTDSTVAHLVDALNADAGAGTWAFVPSSTELPPASEMDVISNAIIYQPAKVTPVGASHALGTLSADDQAFGNAREPIAQEFVPAAGGDKFLFVVNHFKSKGSAGPWPGDTDTGDGQGASNESRVRQATALKDWIPTIVDPAAEAVVMVGDYNSYSQEDPLQVLYAAGYTDAEHDFNVGKYSYSFSGLSGSLDHVLLNAKAQQRATGADIWNINSPESVALQYSRYNYHGTLFYAPDEYAASDHDPVILGFKNSFKNTSPPKTLNLLNINDFHGRIDANTVKFAGTVEQLRAEGGDANTLMLSAGDNVGASLFASAFEDDKPTIDVLNALDLKASAVGNHEFDKGIDDLKNRIQAPYDATTNPLGGANWKYLGANVYEKGTQTPALPEYEILTVDGVKVGVIGAVTEETPSLVTPTGIASLDFGDPVAAVNRVAAQLTDGNQANGEADVLIAEYHEGAGSGTPDGATLEQEVAAGGAFADIVTKTSPKVAAIFTGHTHKEYVWDAPIPGVAGKTRPILQTGSYGERIGQIKLTLNADNTVASYTARNVARVTTDDATLVATYPRVATVKTIVDGALARAAVIGDQPVSSVTADITTAFSGTGAGYTGPGDTYVAPTRDDRGKESSLGNLVADSLVDSMSSADRGGATIGVVNPGGLRAELLKGNDGVITYAEANAVLPFVNNLWTVTLTGAQFKTMLEQQWQTNADGTIPSRNYLQLGLSKNVSYTYDANAAQGSHITSVTIDGKKLDPAANYRIGTFSFLATGGDNFRIFTSGTDVKDSGLIDRDAWIQYLKDNAPVSPTFARHAVSLPNVPAEVAPGSALAFTVGGLNLTSLGSPRNTSVTVKIGDTSLGDFPVSTVLDANDALKNGVLNGKADVSATVPASLAAGSYDLTVTAAPSGTTVRIPITVKAKEGVPPKLSINARSQCWDGKAVVAVYALNTGTVPTDIRLTTPFGDKKFDKVAPGKAAYNGFYAPTKVVEAGNATVAAYTYVNGVGSYVSLKAPYLAIDCRVTSTVTLSGAAGQTYGTSKPQTLTASVALADGSKAAGTVVFRNGVTELATVPVNKNGKAKFKVVRKTPAGVLRVTAEFVPANPADVAGATSAETKFQVYTALTDTSVTGKVSALSKKLAEQSGFTSGLTLTATVVVSDSTVKANGVLNVNINGSKAASVTVKNGKAKTAVIPVAKGTATVIATFLPTDPNLARSGSGIVTVKIKN